MAGRGNTLNSIDINRKSDAQCSPRYALCVMRYAGFFFFRAWTDGLHSVQLNFSVERGDADPQLCRRLFLALYACAKTL
ncbi:hypothetical protein D3C73_1098990 [compost metagenome]